MSSRRPAEISAAAPRSPEFGKLLRHWRRSRGISQLELAKAADVSARHLSFLETGRCGPSRTAVVDLARALELPGTETQRLLILAGYAGDWTQAAPDSDAIRGQLGKVAHLLGANDPFPALVTAPDWSVAFQNRGATALFARLHELAPTLRIDPVDVRRIFREKRLAPLISNLRELIDSVVAGLYQLEPDPASFGHTPAFLDALPAGDTRGAALERAARGSAWAHPVKYRDGGASFSLDLLSLPFAASAAGFALVIGRPADEASVAPATAYFRALIAKN
jgi:transcriptional regulator with XRE-family HTH domain